MPVTIGILRQRTLSTDNDNDGQPDSGDIFLHSIIIQNTGDEDALDVFTSETENGYTIDPGSVKIGPIAVDDGFNITGNTPFTFTAAQLLGNDIDPDGLESGLVISSVSAGTNGTLVDNGNGTYTFTPNTGLDAGQTASFTYSITDAQGLSSVATTPGTVTFTIGDVVWYVDKDAAGGGDGSFSNPFADLASLNGAGGAGDVDSAGETIFIYDRAGTDVTANIILETNQKLFGDGHAFTVNGLTVGATTSNSTISHDGIGITLASGNTIDGLDLNGTLDTGVGIADGNGTVGTLILTNVNIGGLGTIIDIDQGGTLSGVTFGSLASTGSSGANGGVIDITGVSGSFAVTGAVTINGTQGQTGIDISGNNNLVVTFGGLVTVNTGAQAGINLVTNTGTSAVSFNGGLDIDTTSGAGFTANAGGTLQITGASNAINTSTGVILNLANTNVGAGNIAFLTLGASGTVAGPGIAINNLDGGTFSGGAVTVAGTSGAGNDGIIISGGSSTTFTFTSATIDNTTDEAIELNGANGAVTFGTVDIDNAVGNGVEIVNATNSVAINGGAIGATNDPSGDAVLISGGSGAVTVAANIFKNSANNVVEVSGHGTGAITFSGNISATGNVNNGILLSNNTSGTITFSGASKILSTGANNAFSFTNTGATGATVALQNGGLDIDVTSGTGINATSTTTGAGTLSITGTGNTVNASTGRAINIDGVTSGGINLQAVGVSGGGTTTGVFVRNAGTGGFVVTGTNSDAGSGGIFGNIGDAAANASSATGTGIYLENVGNVSLSNMTFSGIMENFGIYGQSVSNFTLRDSSFTGTFGDVESVSQPEGTIRFGTPGSLTGLTGTALFEGNTIGGSFYDTLGIYVYGANSLNLTIRDNATSGDQAVFNANNSTSGNDGVIIESGGTSNLTASITNADFNGARGDQLQIIATGSTTQNLTITGNDFDQAVVGAAGGGVRLGGGGTGDFDVTYNFSNNVINGATVSAIDARYNGLNGFIRGIIANNTIGTANGSFDSTLAASGSLQGFGIWAGLDKSDGGTMEYALRIENNTIRDTVSTSGGGITFTVNNGGATGLARVEATILSNTIAELGPGLLQSFGALYAQIGGAVIGDTGTLGLALTNNNFTAANGNAIILDQVSTAARFYFPGYAGAQNGASADISTYLLARPNTLTNGAFPSQPFPTRVEGSSTTGVLGTAFVLPVPMLAAPEPGEDWETDLVARLSANTLDGKDTTGGELVPGDPDGSDPVNPVFDDVRTSDGKTSSVHPIIVDDGVLSQAELDYLVEAAIQRWAAAGASAEQLAAMRATHVDIADMTGVYLGTSGEGSITVDSDGAGHGWFLDGSPGEDGEFEGGGGRLAADVGGAADGRMDLLTVLMHELGHQVGLADLYMSDQVGELMYGYAFVGERRLPQGDDLAAADADHAVAGAYLLSPITIGTLPETQAVEVQFTSTVNSFSNELIPNFNNTTTVNFNPGGGSTVSGSEALVIDSLTLGGTIWSDNGAGGGIAGNGVRDGSEPGVDGVALSLFVDANNDNVADTPGTPLVTTLTAGGGNYSFTGLAPGNYIVRVDADNFDAGGNVSLLGLSSSAGSPDPDDNVDNDDNGAPSGGAVFSSAITLAYNTEPTPGTGNDTNNTLDLGFVAANQAPVNTVPAPQNVNEDLSLTFNVANANSISVADADAGSGLLTVTLSVDNGTLTLGGFVGLSFSNGDGTGDASMTFSGSITNINNALQGLVYTPTLNFNGADSLSITTSDNGNTGPDPGNTGGPNDEQDSDSVAITVNSVNDPPSGLDDNATIAIDAPYVFSAADFNFSDPVEGNAFAAVVIATIATNGVLFFDADGPGGAAPTPVVNGQVITAADLAAGKLTFQPDSGESGTPYATFTFRVRDDGGTANGGNDTDPSPNTFTFNVTASAAPVVDLNGATAGIDNAASYSENDPPALLATGAVVTDADTATLSSATVSIAAGFEAGTDVLTVNGATSGTTLGITFNYNGGTGVLTLTGVAPLADYQAVLRSVGFTSTSETPGANRTISWTVNDGALNSATAITAVSVTAVDDAATAENDSFTTDEATPVSASVFADNGSGADADPDGPPITVTAVNGSGAAVGNQITLASGALLTVNADGTFDWDPNGAFDRTPTAGSGASNQPAIDTFTYTVAGGDTATVTFTIDGLDNNDLLIDTAGIDALDGGIGNDEYRIQNAGDTIIELNGAGDDVVRSLASYVLSAAAEVEALSTRNSDAAGAIDLTGNDFGQSIYGNAGANVLRGQGGDDLLVGLGGNDVLIGGPGNDNMRGGTGNDIYRLEQAGDALFELVGEGDDAVYSSIDYELAAGVEVEAMGTTDAAAVTPRSLSGNEFGQSIYGGAGSNSLSGGGGDDYLVGLEAGDLLDGGSGADNLRGNGGNDVYRIDNASDAVFEDAADGDDWALTSVSFTLTAGAEVETFSTLSESGTSALALTGNAFGQSIYGNAGNNQLDGKGGNDLLVGGAGADTYAFTTALGAGNVDAIGGFEVGVDKIALDNAVFTGLSDGALPAGAFRTGNAAQDADDRILYDAATGALYFDADGNGAGAAVQFATLQPGLALTAGDFVVI